MDTLEFRFQKDELVRALRNLSPAITMRGNGNESLVGMTFMPDGLVTIKAGANLTRTRTTIVWSGDVLEAPLSFSIESIYLANALRTLGMASEVRIKWRSDKRIEFFLPGAKGAHTIPIQDDEFQDIEATIEGAEVVFEETRSMDAMDSVLKRAMTMWGLVSASEREVSQMIVLDGVFTVCTPGFYFIERGSGFPDNFRIHPQVAERTQKFIDGWRGHDVQFKILKTKRWGQVWGLLTVKVGTTKDGAINPGALWLFSVEISEEAEDSLNATVLRMKEDMTYKEKEGVVRVLISDASLLASQVGSATAVTEDSHVIGAIHLNAKNSKENSAVLVFTSKNAMAAHTSVGIPVEAFNLTDEFVGKDIIEWKVSLVKTILSAFGRNPIVMRFDPIQKRTYFSMSLFQEELIIREAFMNHVGRQVAQKQYAPRQGEEGATEKSKPKPIKKVKVIAGDPDEGLCEIMDTILKNEVS
jgi:hypothetical protein